MPSQIGRTNEDDPHPGRPKADSRRHGPSPCWPWFRRPHPMNRTNYCTADDIRTVSLRIHTRKDSGSRLDVAVGTWRWA